MAGDYTPNRAPEIITAATITWGLAVVTTILRVVSRRIRRTPLWIDDWLIIASVLWAAAHTFTVSIYQTKNGFGKHIEDAPADARYAWALGLFIGEVAYTFGLVFIKWSILAFYWRIFHTLHTIKLPVWILFGVVCAWGIANILIVIFQCMPVNAFWTRFDPVNPLPPSDFHCGVDDHKFFYGNAIPNIVTDVLLISLPVPYIISIKLPNSQKLALAGIFLVGAFVVVMSGVRFSYVLRVDLSSPDITWNFVDLSMWSILEENIAIVCACLPSLKPLLDLAIRGTVRSRSDLTKGSTTLPNERNDAGESELGAIKKCATVDDTIGDNPANGYRVSAVETDEHPFILDTDSDRSHSISKGTSTSTELMDLSHAGNRPQAQHGVAL